MDKKVITKRTCDLLDSDYELLYNQLSDGFDISFLRHYRSQKLAFKHKDYRISYVEGRGFCLWWNFDVFSFIEYLIVDKNYRNKGIGSILINAVKDVERLIIIEIESNNNVLNFYTKNGFQECFFDYNPIQINETPQLGLKLLTYDHALSKEEYGDFICKISSSELQF